MLSGSAAAEAVLRELRARSWTIKATADEDVWTAARDRGRPVTLRLPTGLLERWWANLVNGGFVTDLFDTPVAGTVDEALAAYTMERLDEVLSASPVGQEDAVAEVGLRPAQAELGAEIYAVRRPPLQGG